MNTFQKVILFLIGFSGLFYSMRTFDFYNNKILIADLGGIPYLYSTIGVMFSVIAAFIIQKEWDNWNSLVDAVKDEVDALEEICIWTEHLPKNEGGKIKELVIDYIKVVVREGWQDGKRSEKAERILSSFRTALFEGVHKDSQFAAHFLSLSSNLLGHRNDRLHFSARHMPNALYYVLVFSMNLLIFLSLLIGIKNVWLDYTFTLSIALLTYVVYLVIMDLDSPLEPGGWHLTTRDYKKLLDRIEKNSKKESEGGDPRQTSLF